MALRFLLLVVGAVLLSGCGLSEVPDVLLSDPLARPTIAHATEIRHTGTGGSGPFIQSSPPRVITSYELAPENLEVAAADILAQAEDAGWEIEPVGPRLPDSELESPWSGRKELSDGGRIRTLISFSQTKAIPGGQDPDFASITVEIRS